MEYNKTITLTSSTSSSVLYGEMIEEGSSAVSSEESERSGMLAEAEVIGVVGASLL